MNFYAVSGLINTLVIALLIVLLFLKREKAPVTRYFNLFNFCIFAWSVGYFLWQTASTEAQALFWLQFLTFSAAWVSPVFFQFAAAVTGRLRQLRPAIIAAYLTMFPFALLVWTVPGFIVSLETKLGIAYFPTAGPFFYPHIAIWGFWLFSSYIVLLKAYRRANSAKKRGWLRTVLVSTAIVFAAGIPNYFLWVDIPVPPVSTMVVSAYGVVITLLLLRGKFYRLHLLYFEFASALIVLVSVLQFLFARRFESFYVQVVLAVLLLIVAGFLVVLGQRERRHVEEIEDLNTKLKDVNMALQRSVSTVISSIDMAVLVLTTDGKIRHANENACQLFGHDPAIKPLTLAHFVGRENLKLLEYFDGFVRNDKRFASTLIQSPDIHQLEIQFSTFVYENEASQVLMLLRDKNPPWGTVYRADTFEPIPLAIVRIYASERAKLVATTVTDQLGRFGIMVAPGSYFIDVDHAKFSMPSQAGIGYQGEQIDIEKDELMDVNVNIVMDPI